MEKGIYAVSSIGPLKRLDNLFDKMSIISLIHDRLRILITEVVWQTVFQQRVHYGPIHWFLHAVWFDILAFVTGDGIGCLY